jgi:X-X-X-Leu-X-X-Gly heptad repeat protein
VLAEALAAGLPRGVEAQLTSGYVSGTLEAFTELHTGIGQAADGASELAGGIADAAGVIGDPAGGVA